MGYDPNQPPYGQPPQQPQQPPQEPPYDGPPTQYASPPQQPYGGQPPYGAPPQYPGQPQYGGPIPNYAQPQPPQQKSSLRWLWITLGIIGGLIVLACAGCAVTAALGVGFFAKTIGGPIVTTTAYFQAVESQDYAKAYTYLDTSGAQVQGQSFTQSQFTTASQALDLALGKLTSYSITNTNVNNDTATVSVNTVRNGKTIPQVLSLRKVGNDWKIVGINTTQ